ncbi:MAG TPA: hypothetical protein IAD49_05010 [Candidatus Fimihabitans intestinipullorum]|uniref:Lipoprotein n=1 Tax=Candidatus Fimihabitans intestinipullorum TaxID=2840820 RepID=A0A9D1HUE9_9BACT|nr:hypothetical protein [Candidatus Fimihabitans intestinipullorum]
MISNERKKAMYKKALAALLATTTTLGLAGCGGNEETPKEDKVEEPTKEKNQETLSTAYLPTEVMSSEETKEMTSGMFISVEDLKAMPDERTLDDGNLAVTYCYQYTITSKDGEEENFQPQTAMPQDLGSDGTMIDERSDASYYMEFTGIEIVEISFFDQNEKGEFEKYVEIDGVNKCAGPVVSEELIKSLGGNQKTLK